MISDYFKQCEMPLTMIQLNHNYLSSHVILWDYLQYGNKEYRIKYLVLMKHYQNNNLPPLEILDYI